MQERILEDSLTRLRPLRMADCAAILRYAAAPEIARNTFVPHPYPPQAAQEFVQQSQAKWRAGEAYVFAILEQASGQFVGCMGLHPAPAHNRAEVGYWIGKAFWGRGLATAALRLVLRFGFEDLQLNRIEAGHFVHNPASGRVMAKANMRREGLRRDYVWHHEKYKTVIWYAILRRDYASAAGS